MKKVATRGLRAAGLMLIALAVAHCGDSDVRVRTGGGVQPAPGTFAGQLAGGGTIIIDVGSIRAIDIEDCDGDDFSDTYSPGLPIGSDGTFTADVDGEVTVRGQFVTNNQVQGDISGACSDTFTATRVGGPEPTRTPTPVVGEPTETPTPDGEPTPTGPVPTMTPGVNPNCPDLIEFTANNDDPNSRLDAGWTGISHDSPIISDGKATVMVTSCQNPMKPCGECSVTGPVPNVDAGQGGIDNQRCRGDTSIRCSSNAECGGSGPCVFYFGSLLPISAGGVSTCVLNEVNGTITGTANIESGTSESQVRLISRVFLGADNAAPCPRCQGDPTRNDGQPGGTCAEGPRVGMPCDANGITEVTSFGATSLDCPPGSESIADLDILLALTTGTAQRTLSEASPMCNAVGFAGSRCHCETCQTAEGEVCMRDSDCPAGRTCGGMRCLSAPGSPVGQPCTTSADCNGAPCGRIGARTAPNQCDDNATCINNECELGPSEGRCLPGQPFRGCSQTSECIAPDTCQFTTRRCFNDNGVLGGQVTAQGQASPPVNDVANPTLATLFCIGPVGSSSVNNVAGLPGLGRVRLGGTARNLFTQ